jgi:hypothetical protein
MSRFGAVLAGVVTLALASPVKAQPVIVSSSDTTFVGGVVVGPGQAVPRDNQQTKPGTATLRGRVVAAENGQPLRKAQVRGDWWERHHRNPVDGFSALERLWTRRVLRPGSSPVAPCRHASSYVCSGVARPRLWSDDPRKPE